MSEPTLRGLRPGDLGWVLERHGVLYAEEFGWGPTFEALVAGIIGDFARRHDPAREAGWIAEVDGRRAGTIFLMRKDDRVAQLRLFLVEPWARGRKVGLRLLEECLRFAAEAGYDEIVLWTNDVLDAARGLYERAGFRLVAEEPHALWGEGLVGQTWSRRLTSR